MNSRKLRSDFPIFGKKGVPKEFIYLDSASTSQKPYQVIESLTNFYSNFYANVHRGVYDASEQATVKFEETREKVAKFIGAQNSSEIIFTSGTTESVNFIADAWARRNLKKGDEILLTEAEHHSNLLPWQRLAQETGVVLKYLPLQSATFSVETINLTSQTKLIAVSAYSNVLGPIWQHGELEQLIKTARCKGIKTFIDAAQVVGHKKINVSELGCDFLAFSVHKMLGPNGVGVLYIAQELHDSIEPYQLGGSMVDSVSFDKMKYKKAPHKFEAGTPAIAEVIAFGAAIDYLTTELDFSQLVAYEASLVTKLLDGLEQIGNIEIVGNVERLKKEGHLVSFKIDGMHPHDVASYLDMKGIAVRAGHHCAQPLATRLGVDSTIRVSFYLYNNVQDVEILLTELRILCS